GHTIDLFGAEPAHRHVRIMVTVPGEAGDSPTFIHDLVQSGMDCVRVNCAHDSAVQWAKIIYRTRQAEKELGRPCRILMDLGGPKLRTGAIPAGPRVVKVRPKRDELGCVVESARVWLTADHSTTPADHAAVPVDADWLARLRPLD